MTQRHFILAVLAVAVGLIALAPTAAAESRAPQALERAMVPAAETTWTTVGNACSPYAVPRQAVCCDFRDWEGCRWNFRVTLAAYVPGMDGTLGIRGNDFDLDNSVGDSLQAFGDYGEAILQGEIAVSRGRWSLEGMFSGMEFEKGAVVESAGVELDNTITLIQWQASLYYRFAETKLSCGSCPGLLAWEAMVGVRGNDMELRVAGPRGASIAQSKSWADPVVGGRITWDLRNRWAFILGGDVGGFGASSDLTWRAQGMVAYRFANWFALSAGWLLIDTDYTDGAGDSRFTWDILQSGPVLALNFMF